MGKMKLSCALAVLCVAVSVFATDYYVNTNGGVDDTAEGRGRSPEMPYASIGYALGKAKTGGDRVYVAEGTYQERNLTVAAGVGLVATGRRDYTAIDAGASETDYARCIESMAAKSYVKGFTIRNGCRPHENDAVNHGGGVKADRNAAIIDCAIRNCDGHRGGGGNGGVWIRCYFAKDNRAGFNMAANGVYGPGFVVNCVFDGAGCVIDNAGYTTVVNCTFCNGGTVGANSPQLYHANVYNSLVQNVLGTNADPDKGGAAVYRSVAYALGSASEYFAGFGDGSQFYPDVTATSPSIAYDSDFIPLPTAKDLVGKGNLTSYEELFPADWKEIGEWQKAYGDGPRTVGDTIDIGAGEYSPWGEKGLVIGTENLGDGRTRLSISQNPAGKRYVSGFTFDGESVSFDANMPGWIWKKTIDDEPEDHEFLLSYAFENCYYVDASRPDDDDTGIGRFHAFKTIQAAMKNVAAGGTIRVMPGTYRYTENYTVDANDISNVVCFTKANVMLESVRGARWTVIEGNPVAGDGGVRCVNAAQSGSVVRGFTLRNGGTSVAGNAGNGAGILNGTAVDCVITGCRSKNRGGGAYNSTLVRCYLEDCTIGAGSGTAMESGSMYGCVVKGLAHYGSGIVDVNCTFIDGDPALGAFKGNGSSAYAYNCLLIGDNNQLVKESFPCAFRNCIVTGKISPYDTTPDGDCLVEVGAAGYPCDPVTFRPLAGAGQVNIGSDEYYETKFPAVYKDEYLDFAGGARIVGDRIDVGAGEYSPEAARLKVLSQTLAGDGRVTVSAADAEVSVTADGTALIPSGTSIAFGWDYPRGGTGVAAFTFTVELADGATMTLREFGEVVRTITDSGIYVIESPYDHRFVAEATGGDVRLSNLRNTGVLTIVDANRRMTVSGAAVGTTDVLPGTTLDVTFSRNDYVRPMLKGILVNGEFRSFNGTHGDVTQTVTVTSVDERIDVEAVYAECGEWYVDAVNGKDTNDGFTPYRARQTLVEAMKLATKSGDVVHAAPGVYSHGVVRSSGIGLTSNRVEVAQNCGLVADQGPAVTIIEGAYATGEEANGKGCGPNAIRCVYLHSGAWIQGFTLRGGATAVKDDYGETGGGICGRSSLCAALDCCIENCRAVRGGGVNGGNYFRCLLRGNDAVSGLSKDAYDAVGYFGCVFTSGSVYGSIDRIVNCTFVETNLGGNLTEPNVFNSCIYYDDGKCHYHHCAWRAKKSTSDSTFDDCVQASGTDVAVDAESYRPLPSAKALIDKGRCDYYVDNWPAGRPRATDIAGGQRVYNAIIDIGAGEFDCRSEYASRLGGKRAEVVAATPGVVPGEKGVLLSDGESLTVDWTAKREGTQTFSATVIGEGTLSVSRDGVPLQVADGVYSFKASAGSVSRLVLSFTGIGSAEVLKFKNPPVGMFLFVR